VSGPTDLLDDLDSLRLRTRRDRSGYWLPLLLFGAFVLAAPVCYTTSEQDYSYSLTGPTLHIGGFAYSPLLLFNGLPLPDDTALVVCLYWLGAIVVGVAISLLWYRWLAARVGVQLPVRTYLRWTAGAVLVALVAVPVFVRWAPLDLLDGWNGVAVWISVAAFVVGIALAVLSAGLGDSRTAPRTPARRAGLVVGAVLTLLGVGNLATVASQHGYGVLLVLAPVLIGLAWAERSRLCGIVAVSFTCAALLANLTYMPDLYYQLFGWTVRGTGDTARYSLLLPGAVLVIGGLVALVGSRRART
jgi:hypothetical protein